jgi:hypothetical protein
MISLVLAAAVAAAPAPIIGADVAIERPTRGPVVSLAGDIRVGAAVEGDVIALGGDVVLLPAATVSGDAVALGGRVTDGGAVAGRRVGTGGWLRPAAGGAQAWGLHLLRLGIWLVAIGFTGLLAGPAARRSGLQIAVSPLRSVVAGGLLVTVFVAFMMLALAASGTSLGIALVAVGVVMFLTAKVLGVVAVAWAIGRMLAPRLPAPLRGDTAAASFGMVALVAISLVPVMGEILWLLANTAGMGAVVLAHLRRPAVVAVVPHAAR